MNINKILLALILISSLVLSCKDKDKVEQTRVHDCPDRVTVTNLDSLPFYKDFSDYSDFLSLNPNPQKLNLRGDVKEITEYVYESSTRFDEEVLTPIEESTTLFDEKNNLIKTVKTLLPNGFKYISRQNKYSADNLLIEEGVFDKEFQTLTLFNYSQNGKLISKKVKYGLDDSNLNDTKLSKEDWSDKTTYYYNQNGRVNKEIVFHYSSNDSSVVKYELDEGLGAAPYQIIKYNKSGNRDFLTNLNQDKNKNTFNARSWNIGLSFGFGNEQTDENLKSDIVVYFDDNCHVAKVTKVETWAKGMKRYSMIEYNKQGDLISTSEFLYPKSSENDYNLSYLEKFESEFQIEGKYEYYEYTYDKVGNWVKMSNGSKIIKRKISYR
jgi:hypothetical protein